MFPKPLKSGLYAIVAWQKYIINILSYTCKQTEIQFVYTAVNSHNWEVYYGGAHTVEESWGIRNWSKLLNTNTFHLSLSAPPHCSLYASFILFTADWMAHLGGIMTLGTQAVLPFGARKRLLVLEKDMVEGISYCCWSWKN